MMVLNHDVILLHLILAQLFLVAESRRQLLKRLFSRCCCSRYSCSTILPKCLPVSAKHLFLNLIVTFVLIYVDFLNRPYYRLNLWVNHLWMEDEVFSMNDKLQ